MLFELWEAVSPSPEMRKMNRCRYGHPLKWARWQAKEDLGEMVGLYLMAWTDMKLKGRFSDD